MNWLRFLRRRRADSELAREIELHLAADAEEFVARGCSPAEARRQAQLKFGNPQVVRERLWRQNTLNGLDHLARDARYAARALRRSPGFAIVAVLVMALGIAANLTIFTVVRGVLLKPLAFPHPDRLVTLYEHESKPGATSPFMPVAGGSYTAWRDASQGRAELALVSPFQQYNVASETGRLPEKIDAAWCTWNFFPTLGTTPALGRAFSAGDDTPGAAATVILTNNFWRRRYAADPQIIGRNIYLDASPYTVIGVLPPSFSYNSAMGGNTVQVWLPAGHEAPPDLLRTVEDHEFVVVGRLQPATTLTGLVAQLNAVQHQLKANHPGPAVHDAVIGESLLDDAVGNYKTPLYALLAATACLLLIACLNLASLLVARTAARSRELAIRAALGGGRLRLLSERLMESACLCLAGGGAGVLLAWAALRWMVRTRPDMNRLAGIHPDAVVVAFTLGLMASCALLSGLIAAISAGRRPLLDDLRAASTRQSGGVARARLRQWLLAVEVGLTVVLLAGAGLLLKSYQQLRSTGLGVSAESVLTMHFSLPDARYTAAAQRIAFFERLLTGVRALPGVPAVGLVTTAPGQGWGGDTLFDVVEHPPLPAGVGLDLMTRAADPGYFSAIGIPLLQGRNFTSADRLDRSNVALISQSAAALCFPGENPLGRHLRSGVSGSIYQVVGVVGDVRWRVNLAPNPTFYRPLYNGGVGTATLIIRTAGPGDNAESEALPAQRIFAGLDSDLPVSDVGTLRQTIAHSTLDAQFDTVLLLAFATVALLLAGAGLYGVLAYLVTQRTPEIGIRIVLGAQRASLMRRLLWDGMLPALAGLPLGLLASYFAVRVVASMLYETQPLDAGVFAAVLAALLLVAAAACVLPAWRASRLEPVRALRSE